MTSSDVASSRRQLVVGVGVLAATVVLLACIALTVPPTVRLPVAVAWLLFAPGLAIAPLLRVPDPILEVAVAIAISVSLATLVATVLVYAGAWDPLLALGIVLALTLAGLALQAVQSPASRAAVRDAHAQARSFPRRMVPRIALRGPALPKLPTRPALRRSVEDGAGGPTRDRRLSQRGRDVLVGGAIGAAVVAVLALAALRPAQRGPVDAAAPRGTGAAALPATGTPKPSGTAEAPPSARPSVVRTPSPGPEETLSPTVAQAIVEETAATEWTDSVGQRRAQVIVVVRNNGDAPIRLPRSETAYRALGPDGSVAATGLFAYAFPEVVEPGESAFFVDTVAAVFAASNQIATVEADVAVVQAAEGGLTLPVTDLSWQATEDGLEVGGTVTNDTGQPVENIIVGALVRGADGALVAAVYDLTDVSTLGRGDAGRFATTYPGAPPTDPATIGVVAAVAFAAG